MAPPTIAERRPEVVTREVPTDSGWTAAATSADHKVVAKLYLGTACSFLAVGVLLFALTRLHLIVPDSTIFRPEMFGRISTAMMASITVFFALPFALGLLGYVVPLQIGARGVALPRLNQLSYWLYAAGALAFFVSFAYAVPEFGLSPIPPLSDDVFTPQHGIDAWIGGVALATAGFVCWAINMVATLRNMRAPGMAWRRAPVLAWGARVVSYIVLVAGPAMIAALVMLTIDRHFDGVFFDPGEDGEPMLFVHLSFFYFTAIHTIMIVTALAAISEIVPVMSRKPLFSHGAVTGSLVAVGVLGTLAWMQNLYAAPLPEGFAIFSMFVALSMLVPVGLISIVWIATMWEGAVSTRAPLVLALGAAILLVFGLAGEWVTSVIGAGLLLEGTVAAQQDTIIVITGFALAGFAALHFWLPKITGRAVAEGPAKAAMGLILFGIALYGFAMFLAGLAGQPVDVFRYFEDDGVSTLNLIGSIGSFFLLTGVLLELANLAHSYGSGRPVGHDPWRGSTLEWFALSPPPAHNFDAVPDVRSPEPLRDIREAIREREATYVPPEPLPASAPPEVGVPDPGEEAGMSDEAARHDAPTAEPEDIVSGEAADDSDSDTESAEEVEPADEAQPEEARGAADEPHEGVGTEAPVAGSDPSPPDAGDSADAGEGSDPSDTDTPGEGSDPSDADEPSVS